MTNLYAIRTAVVASPMAVVICLYEAVRVELEAPPLQVLQVGRDADVDDGEVRGDDHLVAVDREGDGLDVVGSVDGYEVGVHDRADLARLEVIDGGLVRPELGPPVDDGRVGDAVRDEGHVYGAVASAEHGDLLPDELLLHGEDVRHTLLEELVLAGASHLLGLEAAHSDRDDDGLGMVLAGVRPHDQLLVAVGDLKDLLVLVDVALGGLRLGVELVRELPGLYGLESGVVVDTLLGVQAHKLSSDASGIQDEGTHQLGPGVDPGGQAGASGPDDDDVVAHWSHRIRWTYKKVIYPDIRKQGFRR